LTLYDVQTVKDALSLLREEEITHAIVDIDLGEDKDGFDFLKAVQKEYTHLKCMVHSNRCIEEDKEKASMLGALAFVPKPLNLEHLVMFLSRNSRSVCHSLPHCHPREDGDLMQAPSLDPCPPIAVEGMLCGNDASVQTPNPESRTTVLIVNDDELQRISTRMMLKKIGNTIVYESADVPKALDIAKSNKIDIVLSDINLEADLNGYDLLEQGKAYFEESQFYFVSGNTKSEEESKAREAGADGYFQLPIDADDLRGIVV